MSACSSVGRASAGHPRAWVRFGSRPRPWRRTPTSGLSLARTGTHPPFHGAPFAWQPAAAARRAGGLGPQRKANHAGVAPPPPRPLLLSAQATHPLAWLRCAQRSLCSGHRVLLGGGGVGGKVGCGVARRPPQLLFLLFFFFRLLGRLWGLGPGGHALPDGSNVGAHPAGLVRNLLWAAADALRGGRAGG